MATISESATRKIKISDIRCDPLPKVGLLSRRKFYVKVIVDEVVRKTGLSESKARAWHWKETFHFDIQGSQTFKLHLYAQHSFHSRDDYIGGIEGDVKNYLDTDKHAMSLSLTLDAPDLKAPGCTVTFNIVELAVFDNAATRQAGDLRKYAEEEIDRMQVLPSSFDGPLGAVDDMDSALDQASSSTELLGSVLEKVELFTQLVDGFAEIHPYAKLAWSICSAIPKAVLTQVNRDKEIIGLLDTIDEAFTFVREAKPLEKVKFHEQILARMAQQTVECAYFVCAYAKDKTFGIRILKGLTSNADSKIAEFKAKFAELTTRLESRVVIQTSIDIIQIKFANESIERTLNYLAANADFTDMHYASASGYRLERTCLPKTRERIIDEIIDWVNLSEFDDPTRLLWLNGLAGTGKSAIAHTLAHIFDGQKRLGSFFGFDVANKVNCRPDYLFSTIAVNLTAVDSAWRNSLWSVVKDNPSLRSTTSIELQFNRFLLEPATSQGLDIIGPIVIIIDALDESGDESSRTGILSILASGIQNLPHNFRFILVSRPEVDIQDALQGRTHVLCKTMAAIDEKSTEQDISALISSQLSTINIRRKKWGDREVELLVQKSEGLFQWASTACQFIKGIGTKAGSTPTERLYVILSSVSNLDSLYLEILKRTFDTDNPTSMDRFRGILGLLFTVREPLSVASLQKLCSDEYDSDVVASVLEPLGSLLSGVGEESVPVRPLHTSFYDFLTDPGRSKSFHVDISLQNCTLAVASLRVMREELRFNICGLESSYLENYEVPGLDTRIARFIPPHLSYSCRFWTDHLQNTDFQDEIIEEVRDFLYRYFLYWLEVLSFLRSSKMASDSLSTIAEWCMADDEVVAFTNDAIHFVKCFDAPIAASVPHIYISALPFAPAESVVAKHYLPSFPNTLSVVNGRQTRWEDIQDVQHRAAVRSIAFSPDGNRVVSGSFDYTVLVWDSKTGEVVTGPFIGHEGEVNAVSFSPDGKHIASGSSDSTILVWDCESPDLVPRRFVGHADRVNSVTFSPDGKTVVSASDDCTIRLWNLGESSSIGVSKIFEGHSGPVHAVAFSPDGGKIVSGSQDYTVRLWDLDSNHAVSHVSVTDPDNKFSEVNAVAFSSDGKKIASGSDHGIIRVWDVETKEELTWSPIRMYTSSDKSINWVWSVSFSSDGMFIASGSSDATVRLWDLESGRSAAVPFHGHADWVMSVVFSPDGRRVASSSTDGTIRVWNIGDLVDSYTSKPPIQKAPNIYTVPGFEDDATLEDGWIRWYDGKLFWVPISNRRGLRWPRSLATMGVTMTSVDFSSFSYGFHWQKCRSPP